MRLWDRTRIALQLMRCADASRMLRCNKPKLRRTRTQSPGPQRRQLDRYRVERLRSHRIVLAERVQQQPVAVGVSQYLDGLRRRIHTSQACATPSLPYKGSLRARSLRAVPGDRISQTQSDATSMGPSGISGRRSRRHPARSGTSTCGPRWSSGSERMTHPPGPPSPRSNEPNKARPIPSSTRACLDVGLGCVCNSPSMISPVTCSGNARMSS